ISLLYQLADRSESGTRQCLFAALYARLFQLEEMHDSQVDLPHRRAIVINKADATLLVSTFEEDFFRHFALHSLSVRRFKEIVIFRTNVPTHSDGTERLKACLRGPLTTGVVEHLIAPPEHNVRHDLFVGRISFGRVSGAVSQVLGSQESGKIIIDAVAKTLKNARLAKNPCRNHQYLLGRFMARHVPSPWGCLCSSPATALGLALAGREAGCSDNC